MLNRKYLLKTMLIAIVLSSVLLLTTSPLQAKSEPKSEIIPSECLDDKAENCGLTEMVELFANLYSFFLKYLGALALLLFVIGGIQFITAGGNQEKVAKARKLLTGTTVGLVIVMGSFVIIQQIQKTLINEEQQKNYVIKSTKTQAACSIEGGTCANYNSKKECEENNPNYECLNGLCGDKPNAYCLVPK